MGPGHAQTRLLRYRDELENLNFTCSMFRYDTLQLVNNISADQTAEMCNLFCAFVIHKPRRPVFSHQGSNVNVVLAK